jgi:colanic acid/amylovoran biosynthesis glycosyltransferase
MRLAYLVNEYPKVSHTFIRREIQALERRGFEVLRIALRGWDQDLADPEDQLERERTRFVLREGATALLLAVTRMLLTRPLHLIRALALACRMSHRAERPLPVHLAYLAEACRIELWLRGKGIQHLHAHFSTNSAEVAMLVHALGGPQWSFTAHGSATLENPALIGLPEKVRQCAFVVTVCSFARGQVWRFADQQDRAKVHVVHCGLDSAFYAVPVRPAPAGRRLVCVGRLCKEKAHFLLLEAARRLAAQGLDFELVLAGDGELRADIEGLIVRYDLQSRVRITGWISNEQVRNEILAARALVLPSLIEGLPVVIMEAMALRRPVISTFVAGIPELVRPGEHGWLVPAGDVEALMQAMQACLDEPVDTLVRMGEAAHERVLARHDVDTEAAKLAKLFEAAVGGRTASRSRSAAYGL